MHLPGTYTCNSPNNVTAKRFGFLTRDTSQHQCTCQHLITATHTPQYNYSQMLLSTSHTDTSARAINLQLQLTPINYRQTIRLPRILASSQHPCTCQQSTATHTPIIQLLPNDRLVRILATSQHPGTCQQPTPSFAEWARCQTMSAVMLARTYLHPVLPPQDGSVLPVHLRTMQLPANVRCAKRGNAICSMEARRLSQRLHVAIASLPN